MKLSSIDYRFLTGNDFSNSYKLLIENNIVENRIKKLVKLTKGKCVLHIGCCDHVPLIKEKVKHGWWLQGELEKVCNCVIGIDINEKGIDYIKEEKISSNVYCANILNDDLKEKFPYTNFDYVILGEVLEHINNPVEFLSILRERLNKYGFMGEVVVSAPNALSFQRKELRKRCEIINSDHKYWFTPYTLAKVLTEAGLYPSELFFACSGSCGNFKTKFGCLIWLIAERFCKILLKLNSYRSDDIIMIASMQAPQND